MKIARYEVVISPEMDAAGIEALRAARVECLEEGDLVREIYMAMYGAYIRYQFEQEPIH